MIKYLLLLSLFFLTNNSYSGHKEDFVNLNEQLRTGKIINCINFDLHNVNLSGLNFEDADFSGANLKGANFSRTKLHNVRFINTQLSKANFCHAHLTKIDFTGAIANGTRFKQSELHNINCRNIKSAKGTLFEDEQGLINKLNMNIHTHHTQQDLSKTEIRNTYNQVSLDQTVNELYHSNTQKLSLLSENQSGELSDKKSLFFKYTLDLHGKVPLALKYQRINSFIKCAYSQHISQVEIITGRGLNNPRGKLGILWGLCSQHLRSQELQPYISNIKTTSQNGGWLITLKQASPHIKHKSRLAKSEISRNKFIKQQKKSLQSRCKINNPINISKKP